MFPEICHVTGHLTDKLVFVQRERDREIYVRHNLFVVFVYFRKLVHSTREWAICWSTCMLTLMCNMTE